MAYKFLNDFLKQEELLNQTKNSINPFLLENNASQVEKIYEFYKGNTNLLYINGFLGTGKAEIVKYSTNFLSAETIVLKYNCFNSTVLDDILLSFFSEFKKMSSQNIISEPKIRTENFTQKINSYFSQIERPFLIILDSFEAILDENRKEILDFIFHLNSMQKVKIIIIGRTFESKYFKDIPIERITTYALEREIFEKFLKAEKIKISIGMVDEFYKHTRGYYFFTALSIKLMKNEDLSLVEFLTKLKDSYLPFYNFLEKQAFKLISASERNLFWFLAVIRHPISIDLLKKLKFYDEEKVNFLIENFIIIQDGSQIYIQDYFKEEIDESAVAHILQKIRQYIIDLYLTQLPLKPLERDICISRQTMRKEIEYHKLFLPRKLNVTENPALDINYLSYSKVFEAGEKLKDEEEIVEKEATKEALSTIDLTQRKNIQINLENLPFQKKEKISVVKIEQEPENLTLKDIIGLTKQFEVSYNYPKVIELCKKALVMKNDSEYQNYLPLIYKRLAFAYQKVADYENSLKFYELTKALYENAQDFVKVNHIKFNIAKVYYETYKIEDSKEILLEVVDSEDTPDILVVKSYLQLVNLEESLSNQQNAFEYCKLAIEKSNSRMDEEILSELYFKYALMMDDQGDTKTAIEFYNKCINQDYRVNKFLSSAYSNIATLYSEKNDIENAISNYKKAYEIDKQSNNLEGIYYSASKLASILQRRHPDDALLYFNTALDTAKMMKDDFYIVSASLAIGDYYYDINHNEIALKHYLAAFDLAQHNFSRDNLNKINVRINDIKFRMGVEKFDQLVEIIKTQMG